MKLITYLIVVMALMSAVTFAKNPPLTYKEFGHLPMLESPTVSPNGQLIASVFNSEDGPKVVLSEFASTEITTLVQLRKSEDRIEDIYWANNNRLLISASYSEKIVNRYFRMNRIFSVGIDGKEIRELKTKVVKELAPWEKRAMADIHLVSLLKDDKEHVLLQMYDVRDEAQVVYKVNVYDGKFTKLFANRYNVFNWVVNENDTVTFGYGAMKEDPEIRTIWHRNNEKDEWQLLHKQKAFEGETFIPIAVEGNKLIVLTDHKTRRTSLWEYDIVSGEYTKLIYGHEKYDVNNVIYNTGRDEIIGVTYFEHFRQDHYFSEKNNQLAKIVNNTFKGFYTNIYSKNKDDTKLLIFAAKDNSPSKFFWLDLANKKGGLWFSQFPYLENQPLANVIPINFDARDGVPLSGYLTMPIKNMATKPPLIIWPHGGPIGIRDYQYFDPYVQFFTNKGFAVLQVNYRGSGGFGSDFQTSGYHEWGQKMQEDLYDGIHWLQTKNLVDEDNSCFAGYSYGGYAALTAAFQQPDKYKCIISIAGVSDLLELAEKDYKWEGRIRAHIVNTIGDPTNDEIANTLKENSAIYHLNKIKAPILLLHGTHDTQVRLNQSKEFYEKAKSAGLKVKYVEFKHGTHYLDESENRLKAFGELDAFLSKHLLNK
ncbi:MULTISPECIES: prolyl oligopeptidase family serine peptidase [Thalassotalea]|uniref:Prolyl oligopeptidase family serine peptidase n=1 Tax=Thalassotalea castellviae TaxID=3075612 RepID=A0ABU2ZZN2_9GAMM|nr:prolyl oligopeptidase family serine peptidase [Thalassotalea sp. W431]MDT0603383.1 prolyl oligopeptidase family serine peptidase [Thalassotalea sp. W431]